MKTILIHNHLDGKTRCDNLQMKSGNISLLLFCIILLTLSNQLNNMGYGYHILNNFIIHLLYMDHLKLFDKNDNDLWYVSNSKEIQL